MQEDHPILEWRGGVPVAVRFDDPYFSLGDGLSETRHVFLAGTRLPGRFRDGFHIAELGFGTGLNAFATLMAWREAGVGGRLSFTTFERFPLAVDEMRRALGAYPEIDALAAPLLDGLSEEGVRTDDFELRIVRGDARETLPLWEGQADAWFLDGFAPSKNPELWEPELLAEVARHTKPGGTAATYSAAGAVRAALAEAGFSVERVAGYGRKRHMTRAVLE